MKGQRIRACHVKLAGMGKARAGRQIQFGGQSRYRLEAGEAFSDLAVSAAVSALSAAGREIGDIDCIVCGMATPMQAIPCNAALIHERLARGLDIPALDINTTCTSFLSALDMMSLMIEAGRYDRVLLISGDLASAALNPKERESYELFSDGAAACVLERTKEQDCGILYSCQKTWSEGAHDTEIRGGGSLLPIASMNGENRDAYCFSMKGSRILKLCAQKLPGFVEQCFREAGIKREEIRMTIPHQASRALEVLMPRLGFPAGTYVNRVAEYGNMVSASIPYALCEAVEEGVINRGDLVLLLGTAAGLTANFLLLRY